MTRTELSQNFNSNILKPLFTCPAILRAFILLVTVFVLFHISTMFFSSREIRTNYGDVFGVITGNTYLNVLLFLCFLIWGGKNGKNRMRMAVILFLVMIILFHFLLPENGFVFPKNQKEFVGFAWSVLFPLFWIYRLLFSTQIKNYCKSASTKLTT